MRVASSPPALNVEVPPIAGPSGMAKPLLFEEEPMLGDEGVRECKMGVPPCLQVGSSQPRFQYSTELPHPVFSSPSILKWEVNKIVADMLPSSPTQQFPPPPTPVCKQPCCDGIILEQMRELMQVGVLQLDCLHASQLVANEDLGVIAAVML